MQPPGKHPAGKEDFIEHDLRAGCVRDAEMLEHAQALLPHVGVQRDREDLQVETGARETFAIAR